ncbi:hypothetical protein ACLB2K_011567 [Fragaria x ananassa]
MIMLFVHYGIDDFLLSEENSGFFYSNAEQREAMVLAKRRQVDERVRKIIELKNKVCSGNDNNFVVINQKGIDPPSLDLLARARDYFSEKSKEEKYGTVGFGLWRGGYEAVILGAGAFEVAARQYLINEVKKTVQGRAQLGVEAFADTLLVVPKTLAENAGLDTQDVIISLKGEHERETLSD